jgi:murein DD-endopeptidase MepM/ murein hydrolase activator NlpD
MPRLLRLALSLAVLLAAIPGAALAGEAERVMTVRRGDTLTELLDRAGVDAAEAQPALAALAPRFPPRALAIGQEVTVRMETAQGPTLAALEIETAPGRVLSVRRSGDAWLTEEHLTPRRRHLARVETEIAGGVFPSLVRAGLPATLVHDLIRALSHEVDFQRDIQPGDEIAVAVERMRAPDGELLGHGQPLHVAITLSGRVLELWRHPDASGEPAWFRADGRPLAGGFLRTPLDGARLTSGFGPRRHPVLGFSRRHEGLDFAAPTGTPVYAAADGVVTAARTERGYGRTVRLRHAGGTETVYAHLSRIARETRPGTRVRQGQVIGAVGSTGMSTGPHLHYEIRIAGRAEDPSRVALPGGEALRGQALAHFQERRRMLSRQIAQLSSGRTEIALAE